MPYTRLNYLGIIFTTVAVFSILLSGVGAAPAPDWRIEVDPWVLETAAEGETEFLLFLREQPDLRGAADLPAKEAKGAYVMQRSQEVAARTQGPVLAALEAAGVEHRPYWIANMIWVKGDRALVEKMARRRDVAHIYANPAVHLEEPEFVPESADQAESTEGVAWNIAKVNAPLVWAEGYTGQGAVVGGQDTGYDWDHPSLVNQYRGSGSAPVNHNYNWHDAIHSGGGICGPDSLEPCDDNGHGTHTMGTMVGEDESLAHQIGVAPGAKWIGCRNMSQGVGTPATYAECYQWFIAPTDLNGLNPRPDLAPDVINNSWSCPASEGCTDPNVLLSVVNAVRAAGILTAHSAGNSGPSCSTVDTPAAIYDASFTVGATDSSDNIASFSSRGPVTVDGSNRQKPDISAPGVSVRSSFPNGAYLSLSGTSMASPHVAGVIALLVSANPSLRGDVDALEYVSEQTASPRSTAETCGGTAGQVPNNVYGWGRIDAYAAFLLVQPQLAIQKTASASVVDIGDLITYTIRVTNTHATVPVTNLTVRDAVPGGTTFVSATEPYTRSGGEVEWQHASLAPGASLSMDLVVEVAPDTGPQIRNTDYSASSDDLLGLVSGPPVVTAVRGVYGLELSKEGPATVLAGSPILYTLTVTNLSLLEPTRSVVLTDTIPVQTTFLSATEPYMLKDNEVQWMFGNLGADAQQTVELRVSVALTATGTLSNDDYAVSSMEVPEPVRSLPVITTISVPDPWQAFLPLLWKTE